MKPSNLRTILKKPFPVSENPYSQFQALFWTGLFVFLFLYFIQPFGIDNLRSEALKISFLFGCITFVSGLSYGLLFKYALGKKNKESDYTLGKWILNVIGLILVISFSNCLYAYSTFDLPYSQFGTMIKSTFLVGIFPTVFIGTISMLLSEKKNINIATHINEGNRAPKTASSHIKYIFDIPTTDILYIESLQNYINIYFLMRRRLKRKPNEQH